MGWFGVLELFWDSGGKRVVKDVVKALDKYENKHQKKKGSYYNHNQQSSQSKRYNSYVKEDDDFENVEDVEDVDYVDDDDDIDDVFEDGYDVYQDYLDNYKNVDEETRIRSILAQKIPPIPVYDFDVDLKCTKCGGRRYIDVYKGTVECTNCHIIKDLDILRYEDDKVALEQAYEEYRNDEEYERRRRQNLEE